MSTPDVSPEGLSVRIRALEKQARVWKLIALIFFLAMTVSLAKGLMAQSTPSPNRSTTIEAQSFVLKDESGSVRGRLSMKEDQPTLELYDREGKVIWSTGTHVLGPYTR